MKRLLLVIALLFFAQKNTFAQSILSPEQRIDSLFAKYDSNTPGVSVLVAKNGQIIFKKAYGLANLEYNIPNAPNTVFHCASVSKQFTAFAIYLLEEQGKLSLSDDVKKYIPELPDFGQTISIKHLLYHTSGLKEQYALMTFAGWRMDDVFTTEQILKIVSKQKALNFEPGSEFRYTNTGYMLLAEIVARASGQSFAEFTKEHIFIPLNMKQTQFYDDHNKIVQNRAYSYVQKDGIYQKSKLNFSDVGATSLFSTVEDLNKWANNFADPIVGDADLIKRFNEPAALDDGSPAYLVESLKIRHAKGQFLRNYRGVNTAVHTGGNAGFRSFFGRYPDQGMSVITLSNDQAFVAYPTSMQVAEFYLEQEMTAKPISENPTNKEAAPANFDTELSTFVGEYHSEELSTSYDLSIKEGKLVMKHSRLSDITLERKDNLKFSGINSFPFNLTFTKAESGSLTGFDITDFRAETITFKKVNANPPNLNDIAPVIQQLAAYNKGDIVDFLAAYSDSVEIYNFPNSLSMKGKENMRVVYEKLFADSPNLHCEIVNRTVLGDIVIDHEKVSGFGGNRGLEAIAIYQLENGKIRRVYFIMGR